jgi:hypothetical protein
MPPAKIPLGKALGKQHQDFGRNLLKNGVKVVFASDYVGVDADAERARRYEIWWRTQTFDSNFQVLKQMTSTAGEMLAMSGNRNPYKDGKLGVIEVGAYADILLVEGTGLSFGIDYSSIGFEATDSPGDDGAASGMFRVFGAWELIGRGTRDTGVLVFKGENRHCHPESPDLG